MANAVVSAELTAQENLRSELDRALAQHKQVEEQRAEEINDLRTEISRMEHQGSRREEHLRREIRDLQDVRPYSIHATLIAYSIESAFFRG